MMDYRRQYILDKIRQEKVCSIEELTKITHKHSDTIIKDLNFWIENCEPLEISEDKTQVSWIA